MIEIILIVTCSLLSSGLTAFLFKKHANDIKTELSTEFHYSTIGLHERVDTLEALLGDEVSQARMDIKSHAVTLKEELREHFDTHREELRQDANRLKVHAQQLHDEAQARAVTTRLPRSVQQ